MGMTAQTPPWLYDLFAVLMFGVAAYSGFLLGQDMRSRRFRGGDVQLSHLVMGLTMAGMFEPKWSFGPSPMWELLFGGLFVWFIYSGGRSLSAYGLHVPHAAVHALMSLAMLLMFWFPMGVSHGAMVMSGGASTGGSRIDPGLAVVIAFLLCASAIFTLGSERRGGSDYGSHWAGVTTAVAVAPPGSTDGAAPRAGAVAGLPAPGCTSGGRVTRPWPVDASHAVMCVAMAFMLVIMR